VGEEVTPVLRQGRPRSDTELTSEDETGSWLASTPNVPIPGLPFVSAGVESRFRPLPTPRLRISLIGLLPLARSSARAVSALTSLASAESGWVLWVSYAKGCLPRCRDSFGKYVVGGPTC